ncbi:MAG: leucyl/phenylalanyl-tRNA--protein transferase [Bacteroidales bacterium]|nr:leucyl/phenylalanyl-tRNA--protein transferase [Bacteroidales bacterium]
MPVIALEEKYTGFTVSKQAVNEGLIAIGGNLSVNTLIGAYSEGIFPWFTKDEPIFWWSPDPRIILIPEKFNISHSLKQRVRSQKFEVSSDRNFKSVIENCARINRKDQDDTWITKDIIKAYTALHKAGYAHSFETWHNGELVGGLYGVSLGRAFFGESMFHSETDASKVAFHALVQFALKHNFYFIDAQMKTNHLTSLGAEGIPRVEFRQILKTALEWPTIKGKWTLD